MNSGLLTDDLKNKRSNNENIWLIAQPDVLLRKSKQEPRNGLYVRVVSASWRRLFSNSLFGSCQAFDQSGC